MEESSSLFQEQGSRRMRVLALADDVFRQAEQMRCFRRDTCKVAQASLLNGLVENTKMTTQCTVCSRVGDQTYTSKTTNPFLSFLRGKATYRPAPQSTCLGETFSSRIIE